MLTELLWAVPFVALLAAVAVIPLIDQRWWEKNLLPVSFILALPAAYYYVFLLGTPGVLAHTAFEYLSFICLIGSLFVVAGGIHLRVKGEATPLVNCVFLLVAAAASNLLGTTGASMVFVRPWLRMNKYRLTGYHVVFFIFIVSNIGGALTPIGDPPLFLGYLRGVPFFWVSENLWPLWLVGVGSLLVVFFVWDSLNFKQAPVEVRRKQTAHEEWKFQGGHNLFFLAVIVGAVFVKDPPFLREGLMVLAAVGSYRTTPPSVREDNDFDFGPLKEVAVLFAGIFVTMTPALQWLEKYASQIGLHSPAQFYWGTGLLSSVLDNAPTYLNFLSAAVGSFGDGAPMSEPSVTALLTTHPQHLRAISAGAVFFGAMTYIGNGPNFLVKSIADRSKAKTPGFFGYCFKYSLPVLIPLFTVIWYFFFRT